MKRLLSLLLAVLLLLPFTGCGSKENMDFTAILPQNVTSLDPQTASGPSSTLVIGSIFEGLCRLEDDSEVVPGVAERWDHNKDYTEFTFHLRSAKWSDGSPVTADDFLFGILRALHPETGAASPDDLFPIKNAQAISAGELAEDALGVFVKNDRTLVIQLESGYPDFPALTAGNHYMPCKREFFEECAGHYGFSPEYLLTNGPFTFPHIYAWNTDYNEKSISLERADTYRGHRKVSPASLTYLIDYESVIDTDPVAALQAGKVDILELSESDAQKAEEQGCSLLALDDAVMGLLLNPQSDSLGYVRTREVFLKTLDREALLASYSAEPSQEAVGIMPGCVRWMEKPYYAEGETRYLPQDDSAVELIPTLLEMLKLEKLPNITVLCPDDEASIALANGFLTSWNSKLGSSFNILPLPESELKSRVAQGDYEAALYTLRSGGVTPYHVLKAFDSTASPLLLKSQDYDSAMRSMNFSLESFQNMELTLQEQMVFYPLLQKKTYYALSPKAERITATSDQRIDFSSARKRK